MPQNAEFIPGGFLVGHYTDTDAGTGCTVIMLEKGGVAGVDVRGGGPATRETDLLRPENTVSCVNAIMLSGGSAFGLDACSGAMRWLEERGRGFAVGDVCVPIVCGASIFDLGVGTAAVRPDAAAGYAACEAASNAAPTQGCVGAGTGASVGKLAESGCAMKGGIGFARLEEGALSVCALAVVNAVGNIIERDGSIIAGTRDALSPTGFADARSIHAGIAAVSQQEAASVANTTLVCVMTNARLTKAQATKVAAMTHDGLARAIYPVHTSLDGDTAFVYASGEVTAPQDVIGAMAADACAQAIRNAARKATGAYGLPAAGDVNE